MAPVGSVAFGTGGYLPVRSILNYRPRHFVSSGGPDGMVPISEKAILSDDNTFVESLFRARKYVTVFPMPGFAWLKTTGEWFYAIIEWRNHRSYTYWRITNMRNSLFAMLTMLLTPILVHAKGQGPLEQIFNDLNMIITTRIATDSESNWVELNNAGVLWGKEDLEERVRLPASVAARMDKNQVYIVVYTRWSRGSRPEEHRLDPQGPKIINQAGVGWLIFPFSDRMKTLLTGQAPGWPNESSRFAEFLKPLVVTQQSPRVRALVAAELLFGLAGMTDLPAEYHSALVAWVGDPLTPDETRTLILNAAPAAPDEQGSKNKWRLDICRDVILQPPLRMEVGNPHWGLLRTCVDIVARSGTAARDWNRLERFLAGEHHAVAETALRGLEHWDRERALGAAEQVLKHMMVPPEVRRILTRFAAQSG